MIFQTIIAFTLVSSISALNSYGHQYTDVLDNRYAAAVRTNTLNDAVVVGSYGNGDMNIRAYGSSGALAWTKTFGTVGSDSLGGIDVDAHGSTYAAGTCTASKAGVSNVINVCYFKFDSSGSAIYSGEIGAGTGGGIASALAVRGDYFYIVGHTQAATFDGVSNPVPPGPFPPPPRYYMPFWLKYNVITGIKQLNYIPTGLTRDTWFQGIAVDSVGDCWVVGITDGDFNSVPTLGSKDMVLNKVSAAGASLVVVRVGSADHNVGMGIAIDTADNVYACGHTYGAVDGQPNAGGADVLVVKLASDGTKLWTALAGGVGSDQALAVAVDSGLVYVTGQTTSSGFSGVTSVAAQSAFLLVFSAADGSLVDSFVYPAATGVTDGRSIAANSHSVIIAGTSTGAFQGLPVGVNQMKGFVMSLGPFQPSAPPTRAPTMAPTNADGEGGDEGNGDGNVDGNDEGEAGTSADGESSKKADALSTGGIIGVVVAAAALLIFLVAVTVYYIHKRRQTRKVVVGPPAAKGTAYELAAAHGGTADV